MTGNKTLPNENKLRENENKLRENDSATTAETGRVPEQ
jgi:hypothetical protein